MGILLDSFWMLHHDIGAGKKKDAVVLALTEFLRNLAILLSRIRFSYL